MEPLQEAIAETGLPVHTRIAEHAFPNGATAKCLNCGAVQPMGQADLVRMMQYGTPRCCGQRMWIEAVK